MMPCQSLARSQTFRRTCYLRLHCRTVSILKNKDNRFSKVSVSNLPVLYGASSRKAAVWIALLSIKKQLEYYLKMMGIIFRRTDITFKYLDRIFPQLQVTSAARLKHVQRAPIHI